MSDFTFLTEEQCFGNDKLDILKKRGTQAAITDFSILLGAYVSDYHIDNDSSLEGRTGWYWTKSDDGDNAARVVRDDGNRKYDMMEIMTRAWFTLMVIAITTLLTDALVGLAQLYRSHQSVQSPRTERVGKEQEMVCLK